MWPGMIGQRESAERKFRFNKEVLQQILEVWFLTDRWLCSTEGSALGLGLIGSQVDRPRSGGAWTKADQPLSIGRASARIPTSNSSLVYGGPTQLEKCTIWPAKPGGNVGKFVVWTCHGEKSIGNTKRISHTIILDDFLHTCKKREIVEIYLRNFFWIFRKILGWECEINTAPKPSPEVSPSKMEVAPF